MPPITSDCADSTTPRSTTLKKPKMSSSSAIAAQGATVNGMSPRVMWPSTASTCQRSR